VVAVQEVAGMLKCITDIAALNTGAIEGEMSDGRTERDWTGVPPSLPAPRCVVAGGAAGQRGETAHVSLCDTRAWKGKGVAPVAGSVTW
jgi:hypothetical protein